jgi:hypothetical protein
MMCTLMMLESFEMARDVMGEIQYQIPVCTYLETVGGFANVPCLQMLCAANTNKCNVSMNEDAKYGMY